MPSWLKKYQQQKFSLHVMMSLPIYSNVRGIHYLQFWCPWGHSPALLSSPFSCGFGACAITKQVINRIVSWNCWSHHYDRMLNFWRSRDQKDGGLATSSMSWMRGLRGDWERRAVMMQTAEEEYWNQRREIAQKRWKLLIDVSLLSKVLWQVLSRISPTTRM